MQNTLSAPRRTSYHDTSWSDLMVGGVKPIYGANENNCFIGRSVKIGRGTVIYPSIIVDGEIEIGEDCVIGNGSVIRGRGRIGKGTAVGLKSVVKLENPNIAENCAIDGVITDSVIEFGCNIGSFAEIKRSVIGWCVNAKHHCSILDAEVGFLTNLSAKTQVVNSNGIEKRKTKIGPKCMIGVGVDMMGGVEIGEECFVADRARVNKNLNPRTYFNPEKAEKYPGRYKPANEDCAWYLYGNYLVLHFPMPPQKRAEFIKTLEQRFLWKTITIKNWLKTPNPILENKTPLEMLKEEGANIIPCLLEKCKCHSPEELL